MKQCIFWTYYFIYLCNQSVIVFNGMVKEGTIPNMMLYGKAGTGKTTVARALANDLNADSIVINCSEENGIDTLRTKIRNYCSTVSLNGGLKIVILDEFDYANAQSIQPALRGAIEEFANNCRFIMTCNYKNRIIDPLHSRCTGIDFTVPSSEKAQVAVGILKRIEYILNNEKIPYDTQVLSNLVKKHFPDIRRVINELQRYSSSGKIDVIVSKDNRTLTVIDNGRGIPVAVKQEDPKKRSTLEIVLTAVL